MENENLAYYTTSGRIEELILFEYETIDVPSGPPSAQKYAAVIAKYRLLSVQLNSERNVPICINVMFDVVDPQDGGIWVDDEFLLRLIPVNSIVSRANIPCSWTQDLIHIVPATRPGEKDQLLLDNEHISPQLAQVFSNVFGDLECLLSDFDSLPAGGNFIVLSDENQMIGFEGIVPQSGANIPPPPTECKLGVKASNYRFLTLATSTSCIPILNRVVFHLDQYLVPIGKHMTSGHHLFLASELISARLGDDLAVLPPSLTCPEQVNTIMKLLPTQLSVPSGKFDFTQDVITISLYVLNETREPFGLCYNNCLAEDYDESDNPSVKLRTTSLFFPDFRQPAREYLKRWSSQGTGEFMNTLVLDQQVAGGLIFIANRYDVSHPFTPSNMKYQKAVTLTNAIIAKAEKDIRRRLMEKDIPGENVRFIDFGFFEMAARLGSLHCRVKVIRRGAHP